MRKFELHWQILIALVLGFTFGLFLPPTFTLTQESLNTLRQKNIDTATIRYLYELEGQEFSKIKTIEQKITGFINDSSLSAAQWAIIRPHLRKTTYLGASSYSLTSAQIELIQSQTIPSQAFANANSLLGKKYHNKVSLENELAAALGDQYKQYKQAFINHAEKREFLPYINWMGDLFMRALRMIIIPLILSSIVSGVANIGNAQNLGRLGLKTMAYYLSTSIFAILTGLLFVNLIQPGVGAELGFTAEVDGLTEARESFGDTLLNVVPTNIFTALNNSDMLSIIFFALIFGFFITKVDESSKNYLTGVFNSTFEVMMKITMFIIKFTPFGIFAIVAKVVSDNVNDLSQLAGSMGSYMLTVILGLLVHFFITLPLMIKFVGKSNPWKHFRAMSSALLTAFSTSSSAATLSLNMQSVEQKSGVSNKITSFTLPLGATINMDGTALYECVAAMFIAQAYGVDLNLGQQLLVVATALFASIGAAAIPMAGLVMISVILSAIGLPLEGIGLILAVDRILDMFRTTTNVWSDSCGAVIIAKSEGEILKV